YGPGPINGLSQGTNTTNRFRFLIPLASLPGVAVGTPLTSTATLGDPVTSEFSGNVGVTQNQADLAVAKAVSNPTPAVRDLVTFPVALATLGPDAATNVVVHDLLPAGLAFVSATPSQGTYDHASGIWAVGTVPAGATATLLLTATVVGAGAETNVAAVAHSDQFDPNPANNAAAAAVAAAVAPQPPVGKGGLLASLVGP